jgi:hypothetical protein
VLDKSLTPTLSKGEGLNSHDFWQNHPFGISCGKENNKTTNWALAQNIFMKKGKLKC